MESPVSAKATDAELANSLRALAMDAVEAAKSGHPGMPMGMAEIAVALWTRHLRHNPANPAPMMVIPGPSTSALHPSPGKTDVCEPGVHRCIGVRAGPVPGRPAVPRPALSAEKPCPGDVQGIRFPAQPAQVAFEYGGDRTVPAPLPQSPPLPDTPESAGPTGLRRWDA